MFSDAIESLNQLGNCRIWNKLIIYRKLNTLISKKITIMRFSKLNPSFNGLSSDFYLGI